MSIPLVATNNVHFLKPEEHLHHRAVNAIRTGSLLTTVAPPEITTGEAWFKPAAEMQRLFPDHPQLLRATLEIAERCNLQLELGKLIFPEFPCRRTNRLSPICGSSVLRRAQTLPPIASRSACTPDARTRSHRQTEPGAVFPARLGHRRRSQSPGIPAVARGSAASSMVTYCLGISCVCPLRWGLYFERFLNVQRGDCRH